MNAINLDFLNDSAEKVAPRLLGCILERVVDGQVMQAKIVEVEAYDQHDAASHSYRGSTPRNATMFGPAGHLYVYFTYGMHYCCNVVTGPENDGAAVLIRAVEPLTGTDTLQVYRQAAGPNLTNGPAKLCQALSITMDLNGHSLLDAPLRLLPGEPVSTKDITATTRIGISKQKDALLRFYITGNPYVSRQ